MPIKILMPALSPTMMEGNIAKWLKKEGEKITAGQVLAEIETDKATMELESVDEGVVGKILIPEGTENVKVNSVIAILLEDGEDQNVLDDFIKALSSPTDSVDLVNSERSVEQVHDDNQTHQESAVVLDSVISSDAKDDNRIFASPLAKRIAAGKKINLADVIGTGPHGRIIKIDVENFSSNKGSIGQRQVNDNIIRNHDEYRMVSHSNIRKIIAKRLVESKQNIPHFYLSIECKVDTLLSSRMDINHFLSKNDDKVGKISVNDLIILAVARALKEVPEANASFEETGIKYYNNIDIAVAVAVEHGLITPVIRNADQKDIALISSEMKSLIKKAKENKLTPEEFQGGGITISNLGMYGIKTFNAIINPPQSCILAVGESTKRPIVLNDQLQIATIMDVTLSCDHRVVDGAVGAKFLESFKKLIEQPILMFL